MPAHVIDKGIPTTGLLAQMLIAKYLNHLPLYRQEGIFGRAGLPIPQSTLAQWVGQMGVTLQPLVDALKTEMLTYPDLHADDARRVCRASWSRCWIQARARHMDWLTRHRRQVPTGSATARAIDYSLKRWAALIHYVGDGQVLIDNNWIENRIRPIATGRKNSE